MSISSRPDTNYLNSLVYGENGSPLFLHLHWHLVNNALPNYMYAEKIDMDKQWKEAIPLKVRQADVLCLAPPPPTPPSFRTCHEAFLQYAHPRMGYTPGDKPWEGKIRL